jgi:hypothetical protein
MNAQAGLAWVLATSPDASLRDGAKAVELAKKVIEHAGHANVIVLRTLAAGYAESGRFSEAIETAQAALQLATAQGNSALIEDLQLNIRQLSKKPSVARPGSLEQSSSVVATGRSRVMDCSGQVRRSDCAAYNAFTYD